MCLPLVFISIPFPVWVLKGPEGSTICSRAWFSSGTPKCFSHESIEDLGLGQRLLWRCDSVAWPCLLVKYTDLRLNI